MLPLRAVISSIRRVSCPRCVTPCLEVELQRAGTQRPERWRTGGPLWQSARPRSSNQRCCPSSPPEPVAQDSRVSTSPACIRASSGGRMKPKRRNTALGAGCLIDTLRVGVRGLGTAHGSSRSPTAACIRLRRRSPAGALHRPPRSAARRPPSPPSGSRWRGPGDHVHPRSLHNRAGLDSRCRSPSRSPDQRLGPAWSARLCTVKLGARLAEADESNVEAVGVASGV
jgi:hypothetical protein